MMDIDKLGFFDFADYVFLQNPKYNRSQDNLYRGSATGILRLSIELFTKSGLMLRRYPVDKLGEGLNFIAHSFFYLPADPEPDWELREGFYLSMEYLFSDLFAHQPLGQLSFNWFELILVWNVDLKGRCTSSDPRLRMAMLTVQDRILEKPIIICQKAALHGLNHLHNLEPRVVEQIIDRFLNSNSDLDSDVYSYAKLCRRGRQP